MTMVVDAVMAGSGDSYRIERVYLDRDRSVQVRARVKRQLRSTNPSR